MMDIVDMTLALEPFVVGTEGNTSCRHNMGKGFTIKASGKSFKKITYGDFVECDNLGNG